MKKSFALIAAAFFVAVLFGCVPFERSYNSNDGILYETRSSHPDIFVEYVYDGVIEFVPKDHSLNKAALAFYPGAMVDYTCYAPLMAQLAERGMMCLLIRMPSDFALADANIAHRLRRQYPEVEQFYIGGHSLGGATAAMCLDNYKNDFNGLILFAAYSTRDFSADGKKIVSVYGQNDKVLNKTNYEKYLKNYPSLGNGFYEKIIEGGNHGGFALYGHQAGDGEATITMEEQIKEAADFIQASLLN